LPRVSSSGSAFAVVYGDNRAAAPGSGIYFQRFDATGTGASTTRFVASGSNIPYADVVWAGTHWAVVFDDTRSNLRRLYYAKLDSDGNRLGPDLLLSCQNFPTWAPTIAFDGNQLAVAFGYSQNGVHNVFVKRFSP
jgi:hypothetical protein